MIEPTGEMRLAFDDAPAATKGCTCAVCLNHRLTAVLAIVERERCMEPRDHAFHPLAKNRPLCGARGFAAGRGCIRRAGHEGGHGYSDGSGEQDAS